MEPHGVSLLNNPCYGSYKRRAANRACEVTEHVAVSAMAQRWLSRSEVNRIYQ